MGSLNLGIVAHVDAGKTSLTERLLYNASVIPQLGSVDRGDTQTDALDLERRRGITIKSAVAAFEANDLAINLIDTPGHPDFIAEVERVLGVLDGAVLVVSAVEGVQAQTKILMRALQRLSIPTIMFINKLDRRGADPRRVLREVSERLTPNIVPMGNPVDEGTLQARFREHTWADQGRAREAAKAFLGTTLTEGAGWSSQHNYGSHPTLASAISEQSRNGLVHPVFFGSATTGAGVVAMTDSLGALLPSSGAEVGGPTSGTVFKIERDSTNHRVAYVRVFSGTISTRQQVKYGEDRQFAKVTGMEVFERGGAKRTSSVVAGQIVKLAGLRSVRVGDFVGQPGPRHMVHEFAPPMLQISVVPKRSRDRLALLRALDQLNEQDPLINVRQEAQGRVTVSLYGEVQKEVIRDTLLADYGLEVEFRNTTTVHVERPNGVGRAREVLGKEGNPFLATVGLTVGPGEPGGGVSVKLAVRAGSVPLFVYKSVDQFQQAFTGIVREALEQGLYGWEVLDCVVTLTECGYTSPGTRASDVRYLTPLVLFAALRRAGTVVCEPVSRVRLEVPADLVVPSTVAVTRLGGDVTGTDIDGGFAVLRGEIRSSAVQALRELLPGLARGEGILEAWFDRYQQVRGEPPVRARTDDNPLDRREYLRHVTRGGRVAQDDRGRRQ